MQSEREAYESHELPHSNRPLFSTLTQNMVNFIGVSSQTREAAKLKTRFEHFITKALLASITWKSS